MTAPVLDAHALLVYLEREAGFEKVVECFERALADGDTLPMTAVNAGEVLYIVRREEGVEKLGEVEAVLRSLPIAFVEVDIGLAREAARFKARGKISYADCFALALASMKKVPLLTGDPEFSAVEQEIEIEWL